jgi:hypothetical protein
MREADDFQKQMLWRIFGPHMEEVKENWRKISKVELHGLYSSVSTMIKSREMRWMGNVACMGQKWNAYRNLVGKPTGKETLGRPRLR